MSTRIVKAAEANAKFVQHEKALAAASEELSSMVAEAIEAVGVDTKNVWTVNGTSTSRVAYVDATGYVSDVIRAVAGLYRNAGYLVNVINMEVPGEEEGDESSTMNIMAVVWDPNIGAKLICAVDEVCPATDASESMAAVNQYDKEVAAAIDASDEGTASDAGDDQGEPDGGNEGDGSQAGDETGMGSEEFQL